METLICALRCFLWHEFSFLCTKIQWFLVWGLFAWWIQRQVILFRKIWTQWEGGPGSSWKRVVIKVNLRVGLQAEASLWVWVGMVGEWETGSGLCSFYSCTHPALGGRRFSEQSRCLVVLGTWKFCAVGVPTLKGPSWLKPWAQRQWTSHAGNQNALGGAWPWRISESLHSSGFDDNENWIFASFLAKSIYKTCFGQGWANGTLRLHCGLNFHMLLHLCSVTCKFSLWSWIGQCVLSSLISVSFVLSILVQKVPPITAGKISFIIRISDHRDSNQL